MNPLAKYKIGLGILSLFTLVMLIMLLAQSGNAKQDKRTFDRAEKISTQLDNYIYEQGVPESLAKTGIKDVPSSITYQKISSSKYKLCLNYKMSSSGFSTSDVFYGLLYGGGFDDYSYDPEEDTGYFYNNPDYHKGQNCQTIKVYEDEIGNSDSEDEKPVSSDAGDLSVGNSSTNTDNPGPYAYAACGVSYNYVLTYQLVGELKTDGNGNITAIVTKSTPATTYQVNPAAKLLTTGCAVLGPPDIKVGDAVNLYFSPFGQPVSLITRN